VEANEGEPVDDFALYKQVHTNKLTGKIDDGLAQDVVDLVSSLKDDEEARLSQIQTDLDSTSTTSTALSTVQINELLESVRTFLNTQVIIYFFHNLFND